MSLAQKVKIAASLAIACGAVGFGASDFTASAEPIWPCWPRLGEDVISEFRLPVQDGAIRMIMRPPNPENPMPRGGRYVEAEAASTLNTGGYDVLRIRLFDPGCDSLVLDGQPLRDASLPPGVTIAESSNSMILQLPEGQAVVLRGIPVALWRHGNSGQIHGTAGDDTLTGTEAGDVFSSGSGHDIVIPGDGNDSIVYTTGDPTIANQPENTGEDVLDLRRFAAADMRFETQSTDTVIKTADGTVRLQGQNAMGGNIEVILPTDGKSLTAPELAVLSK